MDFNSIFGRSSLRGDVIPFRPKKIPGREAFDREFEIETPEHREPLNIDAMLARDLRIVVDHPALHPEVRFYARCLLQAIELRGEGRIAEAQQLDAEMESVYRSMPTNLRW